MILTTLCDYCERSVWTDSPCRSNMSVKDFHQTAECVAQHSEGDRCHLDR